MVDCETFNFSIVAITHEVKHGNFVCKFESILLLLFEVIGQFKKFDWKGNAIIDESIWMAYVIRVSV